MLTLSQRHHVGHDILLARHGSAITSMRLDRANGRVVAQLADGSHDTAPNHIDPQLAIPAFITGSDTMDRQLLAYVIIGLVTLMVTVYAASMAYLSTLDAGQLGFLVDSMTNYPAN
ncbi:hypothetical protein ACQCSX_19745 [Pseudarthrobacter sp. P1]|uniref:hypothetical protein n=1 Tax=Pseudarthrobacter sp. P1 TaxID=3418418 RepID=UPI003CE6E8DF